METMIYLQEKPLMVMLIQGFVFPVLLMVLSISLIFLIERFRKLFFSLRIFLTLDYHADLELSCCENMIC